jgi:hypothetical protein
MDSNKIGKDAEKLTTRAKVEDTSKNKSSQEKQEKGKKKTKNLQTHKTQYIQKKN